MVREAPPRQLFWLSTIRGWEAKEEEEEAATATAAGSAEKAGGKQQLYYGFPFCIHKGEICWQQPTGASSIQKKRRRGEFCTLPASVVFIY
jgi:hypothetical protein